MKMNKQDIKNIIKLFLIIFVVIVLLVLSVPPFIALVIRATAFFVVPVWQFLGM